MLQGSLGVISNRETYIQDMQVLDENDDPIDVTGATIVFEMRERTDTSAVLSADTDDGITISTTTFTIRFEVDDVRDLEAGEYEVGITIEMDGDTTQLVAGSISVVDGVVS